MTAARLESTVVPGSATQVRSLPRRLFRTGARSIVVQSTRVQALLHLITSHFVPAVPLVEGPRNLNRPVNQEAVVAPAGAAMDGAPTQAEMGGAPALEQAVPGPEVSEAVPAAVDGVPAPSEPVAAGAPVEGAVETGQVAPLDFTNAANIAAAAAAEVIDPNAPTGITDQGKETHSAARNWSCCHARRPAASNRPWHVPLPAHLHTLLPRCLSSPAAGC